MRNVSSLSEKCAFCIVRRLKQKNPSIRPGTCSFRLSSPKKSSQPKLPQAQLAASTSSGPPRATIPD